MEQMLLELDLTRADDEELNAIFRCAHSVKGGAATFGFADVAELTHQMETLLDKLRRHELEPQTRMVDVLLAAGDALKAQLARHQGAGGEAVDTRALLADIARSGLLAPRAPAAARPRTAAPARDQAAAARRQPPRRTGERQLELTVGPLTDPAVADNLLELFKEIAELGHDRAARRRPQCRRHAPLQDRHQAAATATCWTCSRSTCRAKRCKLGPLTRGYGFHKDAPGAPPPRSRPTRATASSPTRRARPSASAATRRRAERGRGDRAQRRARVRPRRPSARREAAARAESSTLRVSVEKVDQLINLVGELVITQAMLAQTSQELDTDAAPAAGRRPGRPGAQHARPAGIGDVDPHDSDVDGVQPLPAHAARPGRQARQEGRAGDAGRGHRARQGPGREDHRPADAPGAQPLRPRHRDAGRARWPRASRSTARSRWRPRTRAAAS